MPNNEETQPAASLIEGAISITEFAILLSTYMKEYAKKKNKPWIAHSKATLKAASRMKLPVPTIMLIQREWSLADQPLPGEL